MTERALYGHETRELMRVTMVFGQMEKKDARTHVHP